MSEGETLRKVMLAGSEYATLFRNSQGVATYSGGASVRYGVGPPGGGGSDLIGFRTTVVTQDMVGKEVAIFVAIEVKTDAGRPTKKQLHFLDVIRRNGGISGLARSAEEAVRILKGYTP